MPKPFGKPLRTRLGLTRGTRLALALLGAALPAYLLCAVPAKKYPTLGESPFFWPATLLFVALYVYVLARWLRRRASPRGPWESSRTRRVLGRLLLALVLAVPLGLLSAILYEPAFILANGLVPGGGTSEEFALVVRDAQSPSQLALDSPYWAPPYQFRPSPPPNHLRPGSFARLTLRRGILGARWVAAVDYEALK